MVYLKMGHVVPDPPANFPARNVGPQDYIALHVGDTTAICVEYANRACAGVRRLAEEVRVAANKLRKRREN